MHASKQQKSLVASLALAVTLLLGNPLWVGAFPQNGGAGAAAGGPSMLEVSGKVVETMDSGGYTYALVEKDGAKTWIAIPKTKIAVGNEIACQPGMVMQNFSSPSLQRTFERIVFSQGIAAAPAAQ